MNGSIASSSLTTVNEWGRAKRQRHRGHYHRERHDRSRQFDGYHLGTLKVNGNYTQNVGSTYKVKVGSQSDLITITGNATINGGTVAVTPSPA